MQLNSIHAFDSRIVQIKLYCKCLNLAINYITNSSLKSLCALPFVVLLLLFINAHCAYQTAGDENGLDGLLLLLCVT